MDKKEHSPFSNSRLHRNSRFSSLFICILQLHNPHSSIILMFQCHYLRGTSLYALTALQAVRMQIAYGLTARVVGCELHRADASTLLALHLTGTWHVDVRECVWQWSLLRCYPIGDGSHGAERTPCAWRIDERECDTNNGSHDDNRPENLTYTSPHEKSTLAPRHKT